MYRSLQRICTMADICPWIGGRIWGMFGCRSVRRRSPGGPHQPRLEELPRLLPPPPPPPTVSVTALYRQYIPVPISLGIARGAAIHIYFQDELNYNQTGRPEHQFRVLLLHISHVLPCCAQEDQRHLPVIIFVFGDGSIDLFL